MRVETFENEKDFLKFLYVNKVKNVYSFYPGIGRQLDILTKLAKNNNLKLYFKYDQFDKLCWPYASSGFFKLKKKSLGLLKIYSLIRAFFIKRNLFFSNWHFINQVKIFF